MLTEIKVRFIWQYLYITLGKETGAFKMPHISNYENTSYTAAHDLSSGSCRIFNEKNTYYRTTGAEKYQ